MMQEQDSHSWLSLRLRGTYGAWSAMLSSIVSKTLDLSFAGFSFFVARSGVPRVLAVWPGRRNLRWWPLLCLMVFGARPALAAPTFAGSGAALIYLSFQAYPYTTG